MDKTQTADMDTELMSAVRRGDIKQIERFLAAGADLNIRNYDGDTPLHEAAYRGDIDCIRLLIENGANTGINNEYGWTALHSAALRGNIGVMRQLIESGTDTDIHTNRGETAMDMLKRLYPKLYAGHMDEFATLALAVRNLRSEDASGVPEGIAVTGFEFDI